MTKENNGHAVQHSISPHVVYKDVNKAIKFYEKAFGAKEVYRFKTPDGKIVHADLEIGDSHLLMAEEFPERGCLSAETLKGSNVTIHLLVEDADKVFKTAVAAGAQVQMPLDNMFWGDRYGRVLDPFGQSWSIASHVEKLAPEEIKKRGDAFFKQVNACAKEKELAK